MSTTYLNRFGSLVAVVALVSASSIAGCTSDDGDNPTPSNAAGAGDTTSSDTGGKGQGTAGTEDTDTGGKASGTGGKSTGTGGKTSSAGGSAGEADQHGEAGEAPIQHTGGAAGSESQPEGGSTATGGSGNAEAGAPSGEGGSAGSGGECVPDPDSACYDCPPAMTKQFLNHCTDATCVAYDNSSLSHLGEDGELPDIP